MPTEEVDRIVVGEGGEFVIQERGTKVFDRKRYLKLSSEKAINDFRTTTGECRYESLLAYDRFHERKNTKDTDHWFHKREQQWSWQRQDREQNIIQDPKEVW